MGIIDSSSVTAVTASRGSFGSVHVSAFWVFCHELMLLDAEGTTSLLWRGHERWQSEPLKPYRYTDPKSSVSRNANLGFVASRNGFIVMATCSLMA